MKTRTQKTIVIGMGFVALLSAAIPALSIWPSPLHFNGSVFKYIIPFLFLLIPLLVLILSVRVIFLTDEVETRRLIRPCNYLWVPLFLNPVAFIFWIIWLIGHTGR